MHKIAKGFEDINYKLEIKGHTDLTYKGKKVSGNAQRRKKHTLLFHGTILYNFDLKKISTYLRTPKLMPQYRNNKSHQDFVRNLNIDQKTIKKQLATIWNATDIPLKEKKQYQNQSFPEKLYRY